MLEARIIQESDRDLQRLSSIPLFTCSVVLLLQLAYIAFTPWHRLTYYTADDAFYYLMIGRQWLEHGFPSLDGLTPTSGFQPLWQFIATMLGFTDSRIANLRLLLALQSVLYQAGVFAVSRVLEITTNRRVVVAFLVFVQANVWLSWGFALNGMESSLQIAVLGLVLWAMATYRSGLRSALLLGCGLGLYGLTRVDELAFLPFAIAWLHNRGTKPRHLLLVTMLGVVPVALFFAANQSMVGSPLPTSGAAKLEINNRLVGENFPSVERLEVGAENTTRAIYYTASRVLGGLFYFPARMASVPDRLVSHSSAILGIFLVLAGLMTLWNPKFRNLRMLLWPLAGALTVRLVFYLNAFPAEVHLFDWYYGDLIVMTAILCAVAIYQVPLVGRFAVILWFFGITGFSVNHEQAGSVKSKEQCAQFVGANFPTSERVGSWDAGLLSFLFLNPITNLDGLVNTPSFVRRVVRHPKIIGDYLCEQGIDILVNPNIFFDGQLSGATTYRGIPSIDIEVLFVSDSFASPYGETRNCVVFRFRRDCAGNPESLFDFTGSMSEGSMGETLSMIETREPVAGR